jgi:hypothetical protein
MNVQEIKIGVDEVDDVIRKLRHHAVLQQTLAAYQGSQCPRRRQLLRDIHDQIYRIAAIRDALLTDKPDGDLN